MMDVQELEPLVGERTAEVRMPPGGGDPVRGHTIEGAWERCDDGEIWEPTSI